MESPSPKRKIRKRFIALALMALVIMLWLFPIPKMVTLKARPDVYLVDAETITCIWRNGTLRTLVYGYHFTLEQQEGETWQSIPVPYLFEDIGFTLPPMGSRAMTYRLAGLQPLEPGDYRIGATFYLRRYRTPHTAYAYFTLMP